jgi:hypothetical protein
MENNEKFFENLFNEFKNFVVATSIATANVEREVLNQNQEDSYVGQSQNISFDKRQLLESLHKGEFNSQYVKYFYKILDVADKYVLETNFDKFQSDVKKYLMNDEVVREYKGLASLYNGKTLNEISENKNNQLLELSKYKYPIELNFTPQRKIINEFEVMINKAKPKYNHGIKVYSKTNTTDNQLLEKYYNNIIVKNVGMGTKFIEFFVPHKLFDLTKIQNTHLFDDIKNTYRVEHINNSGKEYIYSVKEFVELIKESEGCRLVFKGNKIESYDTL